MRSGEIAEKLSNNLVIKSKLRRDKLHPEYDLKKRV